MRPMNSILLQSGGLFDFDDPYNSYFTIEDVAHNLSNLCRFNGACDRFFSVLQHSLNTSYLVKTRQMMAHDGAEAWYGDMTTWLKRKCPDYQALLEEGENATADRLGVPRGMTEEMKRADLLCLAVERRHLFRNAQPKASEDGFHHLKGFTIEEIDAAEKPLVTGRRPKWWLRRQFLQRWRDLA